MQNLRNCMPDKQCFKFLLLIAVLLSGFRVSEGSGAIEIKFVNYSNPGGYKAGNNNNQCCDGPWMSNFQCDRDPCDPIFDICLQNISSISDCPLGRKATGYVDNRNVFTFQTTIGVGSNSTRNPIAFPVQSFLHSTVIMTITVYDKDPGYGNNEKIDYMQQIIHFVPDQNGKRTNIMSFTLKGAVSSLSVEVNIRCGTFFFGNDCTRKCRSDKSSFDCTSTGDRVCRPGWTGADCTVNIDECVNHTCQNGASCQDEVNNYTCRCLPKFTGRYCESLITTTTTSTTSLTTSTASTTTASTTASTTTETTTAPPTTTPPTTTPAATTPPTTTPATTTPATTTPATTTPATTTPATTTPATTTTTVAMTTPVSTTTTPEMTTSSATTTPDTTSSTTAQFSTYSTESTSLSSKVASHSSTVNSTNSTSTASTKIFKTSLTSEPTTLQASYLSSTVRSSTLQTTRSTAAAIPPTSSNTLRASLPSVFSSSTTRQVPTTSTFIPTSSAAVCVITDVYANVSTGLVSVKLSYSGPVRFSELKRHIEKQFYHETQVNTTFMLTSQTASGAYRELRMESPVREPYVDTDKLKNTILSFCYPQSSRYDKNKMPEPEGSTGSPGPLIGGVFGVLVVAAVGTVVGFFLYKRKFKQNATDIEARGNNKGTSKWAEKTVRGSGDGKSVKDMVTEETKNTLIATDHMNRNKELHGNTDFADFNKSVDF